MKIIKAGKPKPKKRPTLTCPECRCVFEYDSTDVYAEDRPRAHPFVKCPQEGCEYEIDLMKHQEKPR